MARKAAKHAANVNAVLLACERSRVLFSLDQQQSQKQDQTSSMPKQRKEAPANDESEIYEVEDILDERLDPKVCTLHIAPDVHKAAATVVIIVVVIFNYLQPCHMHVNTAALLSISYLKCTTCVKFS